ncbi:hypothetical protein DBY73_005930 [Enterobacter sp. RIT418]|nr:hypothetical protein DBY73_005930 [Enterobacter sp. RIT 418]
MLLAVVRHHAGDLAGATSDALLTISHNKTIHNDTCFWFNNLILCMNTVLNRGDLLWQCSHAQNGPLFAVNLWQINFIQEAVCDR